MNLIIIMKNKLNKKYIIYLQDNLILRMSNILYVKIKNACTIYSIQANCFIFFGMDMSLILYNYYSK